MTKKAEKPEPRARKPRAPITRTRKGCTHGSDKESMQVCCHSARRGDTHQ